MTEIRLRAAAVYSQALSMRLVAALVVTGTLLGCKVDPYDPSGKPCDAAHPCPSGLTCVVGVCGKSCPKPTESCSGTPCVSSLAGSRTPGLVDGPPMQARFRSPTQLLALPEGVLLVADTGNHAVRAVPLDGGAVTTVAGNGSCDPTDTRSLCGPKGMARGPNGELYVVSTDADSVHVIANGQVTRFIGDGLPTTLTRPQGVVVAGNVVITSDASHCLIKFYQLDGGQAAPDQMPCSMVDGHQVLSADYFALSPDQKTLYFTDGEQQLFTLPLSNGLPSGAFHSLTGQYYGFEDGALASASFYDPVSIVADAQAVYVADQGNHRIRRVEPAGAVSTLAGTGIQGLDDGPASSALLSYPSGVAVFGSAVYFSSPSDGRIRKVENGVVSTIAGGTAPVLADGCGLEVELAAPQGIELDPASGNLFFSDTLHHAVRVLGPDGTVVTLAGGSPGSLDGDFKNARFNAPRGLRLLPGNKLLVADTGNGTIRQMDLTAHSVSTLIGTPHIPTFTVPDCNPSLDNPPTTATLCAPKAIVADTDGTLYFTDSAEPGQGVIGKLSTSNQLSTVFSDWFFPRGMVLAPGAVLTLADAASEQIQRYSTSGTKLAPVLTIDECGKGPHWEYYCEPTDVGFYGGDFFALYGDAETLRRRPADGGVQEIVAGQPYTAGLADGTTNTLFDQPHALAIGPDGTVYVADTGNHRLRRIRP
jgi:sugar lactone lactonase YvrE